MTHEFFINRCLELAKLGLYSTKPNPMVGAVIVIDNKIVAEGFHRFYGGPHAEIEALNKLASNTDLAKATLYVNLEPCNHFGKTPPCTKAIIESGIKKVVIGLEDANPLTATLGIKALKDAGIAVVSNILPTECKELNKRFYTYYQKGRPYITLKWAETADGFIAKKDYSSKWISNEKSRNTVQHIRATEEAILIGTNTAFYDNPKLTIRNENLNILKQPIRILIDKSLKTPTSNFIFNNDTRVIILNNIKDEIKDHLSYIKIESKVFSASNIIKILYEQKIQSVLIEGGTNTIQQFINDNIWDEAYRFISPKSFGDGIKAPIIGDSYDSKESIEDDLLIKYLNADSNN